ncbi:ATP citrate lyase [Suillus cothurnatus]|nr:ATP citrate lyase [Suillus cothurnatus]
MSSKASLAYWLQRAPAPNPNFAPSPSSTLKFPAPRVAQILWDPATDSITPDTLLPSWVGKAGLLALNKDWQDAKKWIQDRAGKPQRVESVTGTLSSFIVEPFLPHPSDSEYYICITSGRDADTLLFTTSGALKLDIPVLGPFPTRAELQTTLLRELYSVYVDLHFAYLEINPLVTAESICGPKWAVARDLTVYETAPAASTNGSKVNADRGPPMAWPAPFGRDLTKEEAYIQKLDASTGASLKLTRRHRSRGFAHELANYVDLLTRPPPRPDGKVLIIGGGIAKFHQRSAATFKGIIRALTSYKTQLIAHNAKIYVLIPHVDIDIAAQTNTGESLGVPIRVFGPDTHITEIVPLALGLKSTTSTTAPVSIPATAPGSPKVSSAISEPGASDVGTIHADGERTQPNDVVVRFDSAEGTKGTRPAYRPFDEDTRSFVYGLQPRAIQGMLDFDYSCKRARPSVAAMITPLTLLPVYTSLEEAVKKHPDVDVVVNFASSRSVYSSTMECLGYESIKAIALIAEGVPERQAREILWKAKEKGVLIIGPATVGGIKPGCFRIGNSGGMMDNIIASKLYRPGSVGYVSKSGGMSNELNNILSLVTNGTYEGIAIGGDRYPGSTFIDHLLRYEDDPGCKMLVLLGEVGGVEEYRVIEAVKSGRIKKPIVAWAIGTCASMFTTEVQFGHAGSMAHSDSETAAAKNKAMREAGFIVPATFEELPAALKNTYDALIAQGVIVPTKEVEPPVIPMDYKWAQELGLIRKPAAFISTISDERGQELLYAGMRISDVFREDIGLGGVVSLLWFKRRLPPWATKFIEMVLMLTADHGPAVSGAMNTIVATRAGKDLISSLASGLLTIGSRFGGALDEAASMFSGARDMGLTPREFVDNSRKANKLISGIGHKIKSVNNPDLRVELVKEYVRKNFPSHSLLDYALAVEKVTTSKKDTLILNVDGCIAVCFVDLLRDSGAFTSEEADEYIKIGTLNGLFVLGRSIGFIGHHLDQKRLRAPLYRHPADDIFINIADLSQPRVLGKMQ